MFSRFRRWLEARKQGRIDKRTARAADLSDTEEYDLVYLSKRRVIRARATGQSIAQVSAEIQNRIRRQLRVSIKPGTYFVARGSYQNMATTTHQQIVLPPCSTRQVAMKAVCINADLPIPDTNARFSGVRAVSDELARFLEAAQRADPMTIQAGVWALTNHYSRSDVQEHLHIRDQLGNTRQAISDTHVMEAKRILDGLGIKHRL